MKKLNTQPWEFNCIELNLANSYFIENGFVGFGDVFLKNEFADLLSGVRDATSSGKLVIGESEMHNNNDCVYAHPEIMKAAINPNIINIVERLTGYPVELQHAKFNAKPKSTSGGEVPWHQDFPFYPHTNFDLVSCVIHLDDEVEESGPLTFINGSHKFGALSHLNGDGIFSYECTEMDRFKKNQNTLLTCSAGMVTFHHSLTLHRSLPKKTRENRRYLVFQYRAIDSVQLGGVVWACQGLPVKAGQKKSNIVRFSDGSTLELRGGLIDLFGRFRPSEHGRK